MSESLWKRQLWNTLNFPNFLKCRILLSKEYKVQNIQKVRYFVSKIFLSGGLLKSYAYFLFALHLRFRIKPQNRFSIFFFKKIGTPCMKVQHSFKSLQNFNFESRGNLFVWNVFSSFDICLYFTGTGGRGKKIFSSIFYYF